MVVVIQKADGSETDTTSEAAELRRQLAAAQAENAVLRETLDAIDGTVVVYSSELRYVFGNHGYHALFPHLPAEAQLVGLDFRDVLALSIAAGSVADPRAREDPDGFIARRVAEMADRGVTLRELHHTDQDRWSQIRVKWTPGGNRVALRIDITEMKRLQQRLLQAERMETVGRISGGVAHDFNNLLTVIVSSLEMIGLRPGDPERVRALSATGLSAAETGARLIRQLLTFAQRDVTRPALLEPNRLLLAMRDQLQELAGPDIDVRMWLDEQAGVARFDAAQFETAIANLVLNARAAMQGYPRRDIAIRTGHEPGPAGGQVVIAVSDSGCGMAPEVAALAFEPFFTTKPAGKPTGGPGLGLSQVYGFATGSGGTAVIQTAPGLGTTVTIRLPSTE